MDPRLLDAWCCRQQEIEALCAAGAGERAAARPANKAELTIRNGIALIEVAGVLMRGANWWFDSANPDQIRQTVSAAARDDRAAAILMLINSPGGQSWGIQELAATIRDARKVKPVIAQVVDLACSAAYWIASQADKVISGPMGHIGSIGSYAVLVDSSQAAAMSGLKVHVVKAGEFKAFAVPGTQITQAQLDDRQRLVDQVNEFFLADVASGRRLDKKTVAKLADGRVHLAADALRLRLIDAVQSAEVTYQKLAHVIANPAAVSRVSIQAAPSGRNNSGARMDAIQRWEEAVRTEMNTGKTKAEAVRTVAKQQPELRQEYVAAYNLKHAEAVRRR